MRHHKVPFFKMDSAVIGSAVGVAHSVGELMFNEFTAFFQLFIKEPSTVAFGTEYLRIRSFAAIFMFLSFHVVHFMQAVNRGKTSMGLAAIRQLCLNIPILIILDHIFGMTGVVWTQTVADTINVVISYLIFRSIIKRGKL